MSGKPVILSLCGLVTVCFAQPREVTWQVELRDPVSASADLHVYDVVQEFDEHSFPSGYHMKLLADVCDDKLCKILDVTLFWDELGRYVRLETPSHAPLTKLDHIEFSKDDHWKLNEILKNQSSLLSCYSYKDVSGSNEHDLDAVSGATPSEVQNGVVQGAAYTTWVLWHWVNGEITDRLMQMTEESSSPAFIRSCLKSRDQDRIEYALETIGNDSQYWPAVCDALDQMDYGNISLAVRYLGRVDAVRLAELVGKIPQRASEQVVKYFSQQSETLSSDILSALVSRLPLMSYYELYTSLDLFDDNGFSSDLIHSNVAALTNSPNPFIARRAKEYIQTTSR